MADPALATLDASLDVDPLVLGAAALLLLGALAAGVADRFRLPGLVLFLLLGMSLAEDGLGLVEFSDAQLAQSLGITALILILYEGGLAARVRDLRPVAWPAAALATGGTMITALVVGATAYVVLGFDASTAALVGAVVASTDAAAVFSVMRRVPLRGRLAALLEAESGINDPIAILLTIGAVEVWRGDVGPGELALFGLSQLAGGVAIGLAVGFAGAFAMRRFTLAGAALAPVLALSVGGLAYGVAVTAGASGFMAVYLTGLVVGTLVDRHHRAIRTVHEGLAAMAQIGLFLMLGLLVFPSRLDAVTVDALVITAALVLVARPLAVVCCLAGFRTSPRELTLVSWAGLRGAIPIVLATYPLTAGHPDGQLIFDLVFFVVLASAVVQGSTIGLLTRRLNLVERESPALVGIELVPSDVPGVDIVEVTLGPGAAIVGRRIQEVPPPEQARISVIHRDGHLIVPTGATELMTGDLLVVALPGAGPASVDLVERWVGRAEQPADDPPRGGLDP